ncbi:MAG: hypothetical protein SO401_05520 [Blautia sp.]|nr:hypothetical protein [Blautia sp.]
MAENNQEKVMKETGAGRADHDESVLNPEQKGASDLSKKERRLIEKEKIKNMGMKKKLEYIWMYYKPVIFCIIGAIALIIGAFNFYEHSKVKTVLSISVINAVASDTDALSQQISETLGCGDDKYSQVEIGVNLTTGETGDELEYYAQMAYVTQVQAGSVDVLIMPEALYKNLNKDDIFLNLEDLLGKDNYGAFEDQTDKTHLALTNTYLSESLGLQYEPVCLVVPYNAPNKENAVKWLTSLATD